MITAISILFWAILLALIASALRDLFSEHTATAIIGEQRQ